MQNQGHLSGRVTLLVAALWNSTEGAESCTLITRPPSPDLLSVHDRMPALLLNRDLDTWLRDTPQEAQQAALTSWRPGVLTVEAV